MMLTLVLDVNYHQKYIREWMRILGLMKILFLTAHLPYPPLSGGRKREFELISRLSRSFEIHLCSITKSWGTDSMYIKDLLQYCASVNLFEAAAPIKKQQQYALYPHQMKKHMSEEASSYISFLLKNQSFDVVHIEGYYLLQHLPIKLEVPILLIEHNVEHLLALQQFMVSATEDERSYFWSEYIKTLKWEQLMWKRATICVALTNEDKITMERLESNIDVRMIPNGSDHHKKIDDDTTLLSNSFEHSVITDNSPSVLFVGNFAYQPNVDAALYFSRDIFPLILKDVPNVKLFLVGNAPPSEIASLASNRHIEVSGRVASLIPFYKHADVVVCPLRIGGGVKVKVLEALGFGKAIVSTSIGAQGLDLSTYRAVAVADEETDFAENVVRLLAHPDERHKQERQALAYARTLPTWDQVSEAFARLYEEMSIGV
jgi:glycosyltransferase involved in cell wall biosynthesis